MCLKHIWRLTMRNTSDDMTQFDPRRLVGQAIKLFHDTKRAISPRFQFDYEVFRLSYAVCVAIILHIWYCTRMTETRFALKKTFRVRKWSVIPLYKCGNDEFTSLIRLWVQLSKKETLVPENGHIFGMNNISLAHGNNEI